MGMYMKDWSTDIVTVCFTTSAVSSYPWNLMFSSHWEPSTTFSFSSSSYYPLCCVSISGISLGSSTSHDSLSLSYTQWSPLDQHNHIFWIFQKGIPGTFHHYMFPLLSHMRKDLELALSMNSLLHCLGFLVGSLMENSSCWNYKG